MVTASTKSTPDAEAPRVTETPVHRGLAAGNEASVITENSPFGAEPHTAPSRTGHISYLRLPYARRDHFLGRLRQVSSNSGHAEHKAAARAQGRRGRRERPRLWRGWRCRCGAAQSMPSLPLITPATPVDFAAVVTIFCGAWGLWGLFLVTAAAKWRGVCKVGGRKQWRPARPARLAYVVDVAPTT
jgi:hypothetical protein